jgi:hypothetical protein
VQGADSQAYGWLVHGSRLGKHEIGCFEDIEARQLARELTRMFYRLVKKKAFELLNR